MTLTVELSERAMEALRREAATVGTTVEDLVRSRLDDWDPTPEEFQALVEPALRGGLRPFSADEIKAATRRAIQECP